MVNTLPQKVADILNRTRTESGVQDSTQPDTSGSGSEGKSGSGSGGSGRGGDKAPIPPPPEPEIFGDPDVAKIRAEIAAKDQEIGQVELELAKMREKREASWFDSRPSVVEKVKQEELVELQKEQENLKKQLEEAIKKQMDKQREEAGYTPLPPSDEEINRLQQQYENSAKATNDAILELEKYKIKNPGSKTGPYPGYPKGKSTPERERLEEKARAAQLTELESRKRLDAAIREKERYRQKEEEEFNIPPEWEPEKSPVDNSPPLPVPPPTLAFPNEPLPVTFQDVKIDMPMPEWAQKLLNQPVISPIDQSGVGIETGVGCCGTLEEVLGEIRLIKQSIVTTTFLFDLSASIREALTTTRIPVYIEPSSKEVLTSFNQSFAGYVTRLEKAIPEKITLQAVHTVDVNLNGAEVFDELEPLLANVIVQATNESLREFDLYLAQYEMPPRSRRGRSV